MKAMVFALMAYAKTRIETADILREDENYVNGNYKQLQRLCERLCEYRKGKQRDNKRRGVKDFKTRHNKDRTD